MTNFRALHPQASNTAPSNPVFPGLNGCGILDCARSGEDACPLTSHDKSAQGAKQVGSFSPEQIRQAMQQKEFFLNFQPILETKSGQHIGAESLIRWLTQDGIVISPDAFIPIIIEQQMTLELDMFVLDMIRALDTVGQPLNFHLFFNIFTTSLQSPVFMDRLIDTAHYRQQHGMTLVVELVEYSQVEASTALPALNQAREHGIRIALDDFGSGYSSLLSLLRLPVDIIKIDHAFISEIGQCRRSEIILESALRLSHDLGVLALAEGAETVSQKDWLQKETPYDMIWTQGFLFGRPDTWHNMLLNAQAAKQQWKQPANE